MFTPVNPSFFYIKVEFKGVNFIWTCFRDRGVCSVFICSSSLLLLVSREDCAFPAYLHLYFDISCTLFPGKNMKILLLSAEFARRGKKLKCPSKLITKTCLYNFDPLKPHFYIVKLGFTGVYIIFLISAQKHRL